MSHSSNLHLFTDTDKWSLIIVLPETHEKWEQSQGMQVYCRTMWSAFSLTIRHHNLGTRCWVVLTPNRWSHDPTWARFCQTVIWRTWSWLYPPFQAPKCGLSWGTNSVASFKASILSQISHAWGWRKEEPMGLKIPSHRSCVLFPPADVDHLTRSFWSRARCPTIDPTKTNPTVHSERIRSLQPSSSDGFYHFQRQTTRSDLFTRSWMIPHSFLSMSAEMDRKEQQSRWRGGGLDLSGQRQDVHVVGLYWPIAIGTHQIVFVCLCRCNSWNHSPPSSWCLHCLCDSNDRPRTKKVMFSTREIEIWRGRDEEWWRTSRLSCHQSSGPERIEVSDVRTDKTVTGRLTRWCWDWRFFFGCWKSLSVLMKCLTFSYHEESRRVMTKMIELMLYTGNDLVWIMCFSMAWSSRRGGWRIGPENVFVWVFRWCSSKVLGSASVYSWAVWVRWKQSSLGKSKPVEWSWRCPTSYVLKA